MLPKSHRTLLAELDYLITKTMTSGKETQTSIRFYYPDIAEEITATGGKPKKTADPDIDLVVTINLSWDHTEDWYEGTEESENGTAISEDA